MVKPVVPAVGQCERPPRVLGTKRSQLETSSPSSQSEGSSRFCLAGRVAWGAIRSRLAFGWGEGFRQLLCPRHKCRCHPPSGWPLGIECQVLCRESDMHCSRPNNTVGGRDCSHFTDEETEARRSGWPRITQ